MEIITKRDFETIKSALHESAINKINKSISTTAKEYPLSQVIMCVIEEHEYTAYLLKILKDAGWFVHVEKCKKLKSNLNFCLTNKETENEDEYIVYTLFLS